MEEVGIRVHLNRSLDECVEVSSCDCALDRLPRRRVGQGISSNRRDKLVCAPLRAANETLLEQRGEQFAGNLRVQFKQLPHGRGIKGPTLKGPKCISKGHSSNPK